MKRSMDVCGSSKVLYMAEIPIGDQCVVNILPNDVLEYVFSLLSDGGMQSVNLVSKDWSQRAINTVKEEYNRVTCFIKALGKNLLSHESEAGKLNAIAEAKGINLIHIHGAKIKIKEKVLEVIKFLKNEDLASLEKNSRDAPKPLFFENLFLLAPIYSELDKAEKIVDRLLKASQFRNISIRLAEYCHYDKSLEIAKRIEMESTRNQTYKCISEVFSKNGLVDRALEVVDLLYFNLDKSIARKKISEAQIKRGDLDTAQKVALEIYYKSIQIEALKAVYRAYDKMGNKVEAAKIHELVYPNVVKFL